MREIKFRAWDKKTKIIQIVRGLSYKFNKKLLGIICEPEVKGYDKIDEEGFKDLDRFELMQFTGLKDKNGKEIYEDDIVFNKGIFAGVVKYGKYETEKQYKHDCITHHIGFYLEDGIKKESLFNEKFALSPDYSIKEYDYLEVIGNIYETPNLME